MLNIGYWRLIEANEKNKTYVVAHSVINWIHANIILPDYIHEIFMVTVKTSLWLSPKSK